MRKDKNIKLQTQSNQKEEFRKFPLYIILTCGLIIILLGFGLIVSKTFARGVSLPDRYGRGGGQNVVLNGSCTVIIGVLLCLFPLWQLIKKKISKNN